MNGQVVKANPAPAKGAKNVSRDNSAYLKFVVSNLVKHLHKSKVGLMHETFNPLWNINSRQAQMIYDYARSGNYAQLQYIYNEIENCDATLNVCVTRRCSALSELDWRVVRSDDRLFKRDKKVEENLAQEQIEFLESAIAKIDNLPDALDHFGLSAFRGFSLVNVWHDLSGMPNHLECIDHWNVAFDRYDRRWLFNKDAVSYMDPRADNKQMVAIPSDDMIVVTRKRQIDWPAMQIFLRNAIGERDWGRFLETYGLPPVIITMPEFTSEDDQNKYLEAAEAVFEGRSGVVPHGSEVNYASESRGTDPFSAFIEHQMKLFVLLATGGTLTSLSESGSGTLAGNAQMEVWRQIVRSDIRVISNAFNKQLCAELIRNCRDFRGQPVLAEFQLDMEVAPSAKDLLEMAVSANSAGFEMDEAELSKATGYTIRRQPKDPAGGMPFNNEGVNPGLTIQAGTEQRPHKPVVENATDPMTEAMNRLIDKVESLEKRLDAAKNAQTSAPTSEPLPPIPGNGAENAPQAANVAPEDPGTGNEPSPAASAPTPVSAAKKDIGEELVRSLQADFKPVADEIVKILAAPESEQSAMAASLLQRIDTLVPDDPAMAAVIAEQMAEAFKKQIAQQPTGDAPAANRQLPN